MKYFDARFTKALQVIAVLVVVLLLLAGCGDMEPIDLTPLCLGGHANILLGVTVVAAILRRAGVL